MNLEPVNQFLDIIARGEERRYDHQGPKLSWHTFAQRKTRDNRRVQEAGHDEVDD